MTRLMSSPASSLLALALLGTPALAQVAPASMADCAAIASDGERLACFDRLSGRAPGPGPRPQPAPAAAPVAEPAATTTQVAAPPAPRRQRLDVRQGLELRPLHAALRHFAVRANYFLFGRYTTDLNTAPFDPLVGGGVLAKDTTLDSTEAAFQLSFKFRLWTTDDRRWGAWAIHAAKPMAAVQRLGNASRPSARPTTCPS